MRHLLNASIAALAAVIAAGALAVGATTAQAAAPRVCDGHRATIVGTPGKDMIRGTNRRDVIVTLGGNDTVKARGGDDLVCTGNGADVLNGGLGRDRLFGGQDQHGLDRGGPWQIGDTLRGGPGDDYLHTGYDTPGDRTVYQPDLVDHSTAARGVVANLGTRVITGQGRDTYAALANLGVSGSPHADTLRGSASADHLVGAAGNDLIQGNGGDDQIYSEAGPTGSETLPADDDVVHGGAGVDEIDSRTGHDTIHGDAGDDQILAYSSRSSRVYGGDGNDSVAQFAAKQRGFVSDPGAGTDDLSLYSAIDDPAEERRTWMRVDLGTGEIRLGDGRVGSIGTWEDLSFASETKVQFKGTDAVDKVTMYFGGPLRAWTFGGDDEIFGSSLNDYVDAGDGNDKITGSMGRDTCLNGERVNSCEQ